MLNSAWVDRIFARLTLRYGAAFLRQWPDVEAAAVKADWADVLSGFDADAIAHGLRYLPDQPLNAMQFRGICRGAPAQSVALLPAPAADPVAVQKALTVVSTAMADQPANTNAAGVLRNIVAICRREGRMSTGQRRFAEVCVGMLPLGDPLRADLAAFGVQDKSARAAQ